MSVGERLRLQRERVGLSLGQVSAYEEVSRQYIWKLEAGENTPNVWDLIARLARRYGTSTDYLLGLTDDPRPLVGAAFPPDGAEMLELLGELSAMNRERLLVQTRALVEHQRERIRLGRERGELLEHLAGIYGAAQAAALEQLIVEAVASGVSDAVIAAALGLSPDETAQES